ncbi:MAG: hypothetical protein JWQ76_2980 [Ramlibacter sp.]|nr:hypothetical protein [Ramlibacter sp.]
MAAVFVAPRVRRAAGWRNSMSDAGYKRPLAGTCWQPEKEKAARRRLLPKQPGLTWWRWQPTMRQQRRSRQQPRRSQRQRRQHQQRRRQRPGPAPEPAGSRRQRPEPEQAPALPSCHRRRGRRRQSERPERAISSFQVSFRGWGGDKFPESVPAALEPLVTEWKKLERFPAQPTIIAICNGVLGDYPWDRELYRPSVVAGKAGVAWRSHSLRPSRKATRRSGSLPQ